MKFRSLLTSCIAYFCLPIICQSMDSNIYDEEFEMNVSLNREKIGQSFGWLTNHWPQSFPTLVHSTAFRPREKCRSLFGKYQKVATKKSQTKMRENFCGNISHSTSFVWNRTIPRPFAATCCGSGWVCRGLGTGELGGLGLRPKTHVDHARFFQVTSMSSQINPTDKKNQPKNYT